MKFTSSTLALIAAAVASANPTSARLRGANQLSNYDTVHDSIYKLTKSATKNDEPMPNIVVFMVDDLGWNQVGYHANPSGNHEIYTPSIDRHANDGIKMERGYMMQWCAPSRASFQTGTTYSFNQNVTNDEWAFDEDIGFYGGIPAHIETLPKALKRVAESRNKTYSTSYAGKWGIGGSAWLNSPQGAGYDKARTFWGDSIDGCDGYLPESAIPGTEGSLMRWVQGYFDQHEARPAIPTESCKLVDKVSSDILSQEEKDIACRTLPRSPPEYIDTDLLHWTQDTIKGHNYDASPLFHMHATQGVHTPQRYPSYYDENPHYTQPDYFKSGAEKPVPGNDDVRMLASNMMRYIDDLFDGVMQSIKDAGQWENTVVLFTSDNGGAVFPNGESNQNYPLRGSKRSNFDGGNRVAQFLTGGWIDKHTSADRLHESNTYTFALDWAPTLVQMAGGDRHDLYQDLTAQSEGKATYGSAMWDYIKNSIEIDMNDSQPINKPRQVSYGPKSFYDVQDDRTLKYWKTEGAANMFIRKWSPMFPQGNEIIPDFMYTSSSPCRDGDGQPKSCCVTDVESDPSEDRPISDANCDALQREAEELFYVSDEVCDKYPNLCLSANPSGLIPNNYEQEVFSYWSYAAGAPFVNSKGEPVGSLSEFPMKCVCEEIDEGTLPSEVDAMFVTLYTPTKCIKKSNYQAAEYTQGCIDGTQCFVDCDGSFSQEPKRGLLDGYEFAGIDRDVMENLAHQEHVGGAGNVIVSDIYKALTQYLHREGFTRWTDSYNWPFLAEAGLNTCATKGITAIPFSATAAAPWNIAVGSSVTRSKAGSNLCASYNATHSWCPAFQNPLQAPIIEYAKDGSSFTFEDGNAVVYPIDSSDCDTLCPSSAGEYDGEGDAYVGGDGPMGICVTKNGETACA